MYFIESNNKQKLQRCKIGGKALNLSRLQNWGFNVPKWIVIPEVILLEQMPVDLLKEGDAEKIKAFIHNIEIPQDFLKAITACFGENTFVAVRSSATDEDGANHSFAGQFESHLYVDGDTLESSIKKVWSSAFSKRVIEYRKHNGLSQNGGIAVIVQEMVAAEVAGVAFGINPTNGDRKEKVVNAVFGLGEGLVSGALNADTFLIKEGTIKSQLVEKTHAFYQNKNTQKGIEKNVVEKEKQITATLNEKELIEIEDTLNHLFEKTGKAQDIEFAIKGGELYLLQTRPITNLHLLPNKDGQRIVWDNSNIVESYPGVTTPLTFSFIIKMYEAVYKQLVGIFGVSQKDIDNNQHLFANMLGLLKGRVYYNLLSWYKLLALLPGYSLNASFMENMMGVKERFEVENPHQRSKFSDYLRVVWVIISMLVQLVKLPKETRLFQKMFDTKMKEYEAVDFATLQVSAIVDKYKNFEKTLVKEWKPPLVNDLFAMIFFGVLQKLTIKYEISDNKNIHNDLLCGSDDIISTEPIRRILNISENILKDKRAKQFFIHNDEDKIWQELSKGKYPEIKKAIEAYLQKFGDRCIGELKLESIAYTEQPEVLVKTIKSYVNQNIAASTINKNVGKSLRENAEIEVDKALKGTFFKKRFFAFILNKTRQLVSNRENLRYERTRAFGMVRKMFLAIGKKFYAENIIAHPRDIFYLTKEEIFDFIGGTSINVNLPILIDARKKEFESYGNLPTPNERIETFGIVSHANDFYQKKADTEPFDGDLQGIGCCPGRVKAKVRVVMNPNEVNDLEGGILVTSSTDPAWVTLFPTASAIIVERGSLLSHSAIVSREMGKPCIVGVTGLLDSLKTGDWVEMDGSTGEIRVCSEVFADALVETI